MFFCLPFRVGQSRDDNITPVANAVLVATNILVFLFSETVLWRSYLIFNTITYSFVHVGFWHLFCNIWALWIFGNRLNRRLGNFWYPVVYLGTSIIIGVLLRLLLRFEVFGASGCIFAVITVCLILMPRIMIEVLCVALFPLSLLVAIFSKPNYWAYWLVRFGRFRIKALWCLFILPVLGVLSLLLWGWNWANLEHLLGLACGVGAVLMLPECISIRQRPKHKQLSYGLAWKDEI